MKFFSFSALFFVSVFSFHSNHVYADLAGKQSFRVHGKYADFYEARTHERAFFDGTLVRPTEFDFANGNKITLSGILAVHSNLNVYYSDVDSAVTWKMKDGKELKLYCPGSIIFHPNRTYEGNCQLRFTTDFTVGKSSVIVRDNSLLALHDNEQLAFAKHAFAGQIDVGDDKLVPIHPKTPLYFHKNATVRALIIKKGASFFRNIAVLGKTEFHSLHREHRTMGTEFYENKNVKKGTMKNSKTATIEGKKIVTLVNAMAYFHENGRLAWTEIDEKKSSNKLSVDRNGTICLNEQGSFVEHSYCEKKFLGGN